MILNKKFSGAWNFRIDKYYLMLNFNKSKTRIKWKQKLDFNKSLDYTFLW